MLLTDRINQANDALKARDFNQAIQLFDSLRTEYPDVVETYYGLAKAYFLSDRPSEAIAPINQYLNRISPSETKQRALAYDLLGQCYNVLNNTTAEETFKNATTIDPECASAWHNLGLYYMKQAAQTSDSAEIIAHFKTAKDCLIAAWPFGLNNPLFLHSLASWHEQYVELIEHFIQDEAQQSQETHNHYKRALSFYDKALQYCNDDPIFKNIIMSNYAECLALYGHVYYQDHDYTNAKKLYQECLTYNSTHASALTQLGMCCLKEKNGSEARRYFAIALSNEEQDAEDRAGLHCNMGCAFTLEKNWEKAEAEFNEAIKIYPEIDLTEELADLATARSIANLTSRPPAYASTRIGAEDLTVTCSSSSSLQK